ncbi:LPS translocon maturation chaperone LptM [Bisgaard Taxon 45]
MKKWVAIFLLGTMCALSVGCGVKGPLYFAENEPVQKTQ